MFCRGQCATTEIFCRCRIPSASIHDSPSQLQRRLTAKSLDNRAQGEVLGGVMQFCNARALAFAQIPSDADLAALAVFKPKKALP